MDHDLPETEDLMHALSKHAVVLARKGWYEMATDVDTAATKLRILQDDVEDLAAQVAELSAALRRTERDRDDLREEMYYVQDQRDDERAERALQEDRCEELQLLLDDARAIEAGLRADLAGMSADLRETENRAAHWGCDD